MTFKRFGLSNDLIISGLKTQNRRIIQRIYDMYFPTIQYYLYDKGCSLQETQDIFQDALIILYEKVKNNTLRLDGAFSTLLFGVCKNRWLQIIHQKELIKSVNVDDYMFYAMQDVEEKIAEDRKLELQEKLMKKHLPKIGEKNKQILMASIDHSMVEMAEMFHLTVDSAKTRKYICKTKLQKLIQKDKKYNELKSL